MMQMSRGRLLRGTQNIGAATLPIVNEQLFARLNVANRRKRQAPRVHVQRVNSVAAPLRIIVHRAKAARHKEDVRKRLPTAVAVPLHPALWVRYGKAGA